jgi:peroxiredoxin
VPPPGPGLPVWTGCHRLELEAVSFFRRLRDRFRGKKMTTILAGHRAPDFSLPATSGKIVSLSEQLKTGPVVLAFYKISCPVCQYTFPFLERIHKACEDTSASVLGISQDDRADSLEFMKEYGISFPSLIDAPNYTVSNAFGLTNVPTVFLIQPDGQVTVSSMGFEKAALEAIARELAQHTGRPVAQVFLPEESVPDYKPG